MDENTDKAIGKVSQLKAALGELSFVELRNVQAWLAKLIAERQEEELVALRQRIQEEVDKAGFRLEQVIGRPEPLSPKQNKPTKMGGLEGKARLKYQHPDEPLQVWSGRGRPPKWYQKLKEEGREPVPIPLRGDPDDFNN